MSSFEEILKKLQKSSLTTNSEVENIDNNLSSNNQNNVLNTANEVKNNSKNIVINTNNYSTNDSELTYISINGKKISNFLPYEHNYYISLPANTINIPTATDVICGYCYYGCSIQIEEIKDINSSNISDRTMKITSFSADKTNKTEYNISFILKKNNTVIFLGQNSSSVDTISTNTRLSSIYGSYMNMKWPVVNNSISIPYEYKDISYLQITAIPENKYATATVEPTSYEDIILYKYAYINVTAQKGNTKKYTININFEKNNDVKLYSVWYDNTYLDITSLNNNYSLTVNIPWYASLPTVNCITNDKNATATVENDIIAKTTKIKVVAENKTTIKYYNIKFVNNPKYMYIMKTNNPKELSSFTINDIENNYVTKSLFTANKISYNIPSEMSFLYVAIPADSANYYPGIYCGFNAIPTDDDYCVKALSPVMYNNSTYMLTENGIHYLLIRNYSPEYSEYNYEAPIYKEEYPFDKYTLYIKEIDVLLSLKNRLK